MRPTVKQPFSTHSIDRQMMLLLKRDGAQTIEDLATRTGVGWERILFSVDRLSRTGKISLRLVRPCEYLVAVAGLVRDPQAARLPESGGRCAEG